MPQVLKSKGFSRFTPSDKVEEALEEYLEAFIKEMLSKYLPKADRRQFRIDQAIKDLSVVRDVANSEDGYGLYSYWLNKVKIQGEEEKSKLAELSERLKAEYKVLKPYCGNSVASYARNEKKNSGKWPAEAEKAYLTMAKTCKEIFTIIDSLIKGLEKLKAEFAK